MYRAVPQHPPLPTTALLLQGPTMWVVMNGSAATGTTPQTTCDFYFDYPDDFKVRAGRPGLLGGGRCEKGVTESDIQVKRHPLPSLPCAQRGKVKIQTGNRALPC